MVVSILFSNFLSTYVQSMYTYISVSEPIVFEIETFKEQVALLARFLTDVRGKS